MLKPPGNTSNLESRIAQCAAERDSTVRRIQRAVANTVLGQLLPAGVVKGGTALKLRVGEKGSRFTPDLDASRAAELSLEDYIDQLQQALETGWAGFTGTVAAIEPRAPGDIPEDYVMRPFDVALSYRGRRWLTVRLELGRDEVGSTARRELRLADDLRELFETLGLPDPEPIPVLAAEHQIVQKLHACTYVSHKRDRNDRAHDLVDLQILEQEEDVDWTLVGELGARLFAARGTHPWPPTVTAYDGWSTAYVEAADGLAVLGDVEAAVTWANSVIARNGDVPRRSTAPRP